MEVADIFNEYGKSYRQTYPMSIGQHQTMNSIVKCRTAALGGHVDVCDDCGHTKISYNSCRNRHCPKCQTLKKEKWIDKQKHNLLNVAYFHAVFSIPAELNPIVYQNQKDLYNILFKAVSETLKELAKDKKFLGADIGFTCVLHTWGQNLMHHPHIHCIIPSGGIDNYGKWINSKKDFFIPVKVLSRKFRGKFLYYLKQHNLGFKGKLYYLNDPYELSSLIDMLYKKEWIVYCKKPFNHPNAVIEYLGRYTHRVAISNHRILIMKNGQVSFKWRDYKDNSKWKVMTISAHEFIRRFLIHVLPKGYMKIRHYGFLGNRNKESKLEICKIATLTPLFMYVKRSTIELIEELIGRKPNVCPKCGKENFHRYIGLSPPIFTKTA